MASEHPAPRPYRATPTTSEPPGLLAVPAVAWSHLKDLLDEGHHLDPRNCEACEHLHDAIIAARGMRGDDLSFFVRVWVRRSDLVGRMPRVMGLREIVAIGLAEPTEAVLRFGPFDSDQAGPELEARIGVAVERAGLAVLAIAVEGSA